jgi:hypothetical protein
LKNTEQDTKMNTDLKFSSESKSANNNKHPLEEEKNQHSLIVDEGEEEQDEDMNDSP